MLRPTPHSTVAVAIVLAMAVCPPATSGPLKGKVKKSIYYSPAENFSLPVPKGDGSDWAGFVGVHTHEGYATDGAMGVVSFADDFGKVLGIGFLLAHEQALPALADTTQTFVLIEEWIRQFALPNFFSSASTGSRVVRVDEIRFAGAPAALALVNIPGGSTIAVVTDGKQRTLDSRRGLLVFVRDGYVYMLYNETLPRGEALADSVNALTLNLDTLVRAQLEPFYDTIRFSAGGKPTR